MTEENKARKGHARIGMPTAGMTRPGAVNLNQWNRKDWKADIGLLLTRYGKCRSKDMKRASGEKTVTNRRQALERTMSLLQQHSRGVQTLAHLKPRLIKDIIGLWRDEGISELTQTHYFTVLRWFWQLHGITVGTIKTYVEDRQAYVIPSAAKFDRSVSAQVDPEQVFQALLAVDERMKLYAELAHFAGLRRAECICLDPHASDLGSHLKIERGAKGGRPRTVDLNEAGPEAYQRARAAIDRLKQMTPLGEHAGWPGLSLKQAIRRFCYLADRAGVNKRTMGATFHGFRADYAINTLERLTGEKAPIRGGNVVDYERLRQHQQRVSQQLGHNRVKVTTAYYGSFAAMKKRAQNNFVRSWSMLEPHLPAVRSILQAYDVENLYLIGARAMGIDVAATEPFQLMLPDGIDAALAELVGSDIERALTKAIGVPVMVSPILGSSEAARAEVLKRAFALFAHKAQAEATREDGGGDDEDLLVNAQLRAPGPRPVERGWYRAGARSTAPTSPEHPAAGHGCANEDESKDGVTSGGPESAR